MKVSLVLTSCVLACGLTVAVGCARTHSKATTQSAEIVSSQPIQAPPAAVVEEPDTSLLTATNEKPRIVSEPPPRPQIEVVGAAPGPNLTWIPGHWQWDGHWIWKAGEWATMPSASATWVPGRWAKRDQVWVWVPGYWRLLALR